jgi:hypothetical protein
VTVHVYVGPTLAAAEVAAVVPDARLHAPVQHGDLLRARLREGDRVLLIDGYYHQAGAVRHKEILDLLDSGVIVAGAASMGAMRAAELSDLGMIGVGEIFEMYRTGVIAGDDEVAVVHGEPPDYRRFSEALVNIRYALRQAVAYGVVGQIEAAGLLRHASAMSYTRRSWRAIEDAVQRTDPWLLPALRRMGHLRSADPPASDLKALDARRALHDLTGAQPPPEQALGWRLNRSWRTRLLYDWKARFRGEVVEDIFADDLSIARYQQLYDPRFPARWRAFVLGKIAGVSQPGMAPGDLVPAALLAAADAGLSYESLSQAQKAEWLTPGELASLLPDEAMSTILVRSYQPPRGLSELIEVTAEPLTARQATRSLVAAAFAANEAAAAKAPHWQVSHLNRDILGSQLTKIWGGVAPAGLAALDAHARDRGLASFDAAVEVFRPFFLKQRLDEASHAAVPQPSFAGTTS